MCFSMSTMASEYLQSYAESIGQIQMNADRLNFEYVNFYTSVNVSNLDGEYVSLKDTAAQLNHILFLNFNKIKIKLCDETSFGKGYICLGRRMLLSIKQNYPNSEKFLINFLVAHEMGHYLQDLHCKLFETHVSVDFCTDPNKLLGFGSTNSKEYKIIQDLHNGTDNYGFVILNLLGVKVVSDEMASDLYSFMEGVVHSSPRRLNNAIRALNLNIKELVEPIYK